VPHAEQEMFTLPEHQISPLVFIEVHVVLSFVSPYTLRKKIYTTVVVRSVVTGPDSSWGLMLPVH